VEGEAECVRRDVCVHREHNLSGFGNDPDGEERVVPVPGSWVVIVEEVKDTTWILLA
jgi:hypothetical protein